VDVLTGKDAAIGILAALASRDRTGRGDHVQVTLLTSLLGGLVNQAANYLSTGIAPRRLGNRHPSIAPYETLQCADGLLAVACGNDRQFARLAEVLGCAELARDARFATNPDRVAHREALVAELETAMSAGTAAAWEQRLTAVGVPAGLVGDIGDALDRADRLGLQPLVTPGPDAVPQVRHPVEYAASPAADAVAAPRLGQHSEQVRSWLAESSSALLPHPSRAATSASTSDTDQERPVSR
jgi:formyl-CoA transferase